MPAPAGRDLEQTRVRLEAWFARQLPSASEVRVGGLSGPSFTGFSNDTLLFDVSWRSAGVDQRRGYVVRIKPTGFQIFPEYDLRQQFRVLQILADTDVPVAPVHWFEDDGAILGAPFYVMERVAGRIPTDNPPYHAGGWMTEIEPTVRAAIWWSGLDQLARIHRLDWQRLGLDCVGPNGDPLAHQLDFYERFLDWAAAGRPQPVSTAALDWLQRHRPRDEPRGFCWGDARIGNMIFDDSRCVAVLDWEMATLGNPEQDLAWWLFLDRHHSEGIGVPRLEGIPDRAETVARYTDLTGRPIRHLEYYEVFAAFRFAVIMIRVAQQMIFYELLPADSDFDSNNIVTRLLAGMLE